MEIGLKCEGILRVSGPSTDVKKLKESLLKGEEVKLETIDIHIVVGALKSLLAEMEGTNHISSRKC